MVAEAIVSSDLAPTIALAVTRFAQFRALENGLAKALWLAALPAGYFAFLRDRLCR